MSDTQTISLPIQLSDGTVVFAEVQQTDREEEVSLKDYNINDALSSLKSLVSDILTPLDEFSCDKVALELNVGLAVQSGKLTSLLIKGSGTSSFKITLEFTPTLNSK